jgi:tRNA pseudouridine38-40 synthase
MRSEAGEIFINSASGSNLKLIIQYDGSGFSGYELQPGKRTIRGELEQAFKRIYKTSVKLYSSSRTDAGVHALGNVISFHAPLEIELSHLPAALNSLLPEDIRVIKAESVKDDFNARFDAKSKTYEYLIFNGRIMPPSIRKLAWQVKPRLKLTAMKKAAKYLVGKHDFSSFCAAGSDDKDFVREIHSLVIGNWSLVIWGGEKKEVIRIRITGDGFLYKMVRNLVGTLVEVGLGQREPGEIKEILAAKDRRQAGKTAPAHGLCLIKVVY